MDPHNDNLSDIFGSQKIPMLIFKGNEEDTSLVAIHSFEATPEVAQHIQTQMAIGAMDGDGALDYLTEHADIKESAEMPKELLYAIQTQTAHQVSEQIMMQLAMQQQMHGQGFGFGGEDEGPGPQDPNDLGL